MKQWLHCALEFRAPMTLDATGRDAFSVSRNGWKVRDPYLNKIAIWTYYKGAMRDPGVDEGATTIAYVPDKGWFWYIPLAGNVVSVGIVAEKDYLYNGSKDLAEIFHRDVGLLLDEEALLRPVRHAGEVRQHFADAHRVGRGAVGVLLLGNVFGDLNGVLANGAEAFRDFLGSVVIHRFS